MCTVSLGARNLDLRFGNKRATSLPGDGETEYSYCVCVPESQCAQFHLAHTI